MTQVNIEKLLNMAVMDVPQVQMAAVFGVTEGRISQIVNSEEFKRQLAERKAEDYEKSKTLNEAWDRAEALALNNLLNNLSWNTDPQHSLRVAALANRAQRRGNVNQPLDGRLGTRAVINLRQTFIARVQQNNFDRERAVQELPQKDVNVMAPGDVEKNLLDNQTNDEEELIPALPEDFLAEAS